MSESLKTRRSHLDSQRRRRGRQALWRFFCLGGFVGALVWVMSWPEWTIREQSQIRFQGQERLSEPTLYQALPLQFPQAIWQLSTPQLARQIAHNPALARAEVSRQLFPAQLTVYVRERRPVAAAQQGGTKGYLDQEGVFIPAKLYTRPETQKKLPQTPVFLGYDSQYKSFWQKNYPLIRDSPVKITLINGNNPSNLTLTTALGSVHLGSDLSQFPQQLTALAQLRQLPSRVPSHRVGFLDLSNPQTPSLRLAPAPKVKEP
ncbi:MAG: cell division protein FtsQ/DivIB [Cyanobacteriota bacterium]